MIVGVGADIVEIRRVGRAVQSQNFVKKCYNISELHEKTETLAGFFAAKEAVAKSFGTGFNGFFPYEIEISRNEQGAPFVNLHGVARKISQSLGITNIMLSISHEKEYAVAFAVAINTGTTQ